MYRLLDSLGPAPDVIAPPPPSREPAANSSIDYRAQMWEARDQGEEGACVAVSTVAVLEFWKRRTANLQERLSPQFLFDMRASTQQMLMDDAVRVLTTAGTCLERSHPYGHATPASEIAASVKQEALQFRIRGVREYDPRAPDALNTLRRALVDDGPLLFAVALYNTNTTQPWAQQHASDEIVGFHQMCLVGYDDATQHFIVLNSWGTHWGERGCTFLPYEDLPLVRQVWSLQDRPSPIQHTAEGEGRKHKKAAGCCVIS